jgi:hypothetical protein
MGAMMSMPERVSKETRRKTGWILPAVISGGVGIFLPESAGEVISQSERLWSGVLALAGCAAGLLWQWYSPRDLVGRLIFPSAAIMVLAVLYMLPGGEWIDKGPSNGFWFPLGVISGLVLMTSLQRTRTED